MLWPVLTLTALTGLGVGFLVSYYGNARHRWYVRITSYVGWLFPFCIVFLLPIDLTSVGRTCADWTRSAANVDPARAYPRWLCIGRAGCPANAPNSPLLLCFSRIRRARLLLLRRCTAAGARIPQPLARPRRWCWSPNLFSIHSGTRSTGLLSCSHGRSFR